MFEDYVKYVKYLEEVGIHSEKQHPVRSCGCHYNRAGEKMETRGKYIIGRIFYCSVNNTIIFLVFDTINKNPNHPPQNLIFVCNPLPTKTTLSFNASHSVCLLMFHALSKGI